MYNYRCDVNTGFERLKAVNQVQPYTRQQISWESFDTLVNLLTASVEETFSTWGNKHQIDIDEITGFFLFLKFDFFVEWREDNIFILHIPAWLIDGNRSSEI